jgi:hypothetical protein
VGKILVRIRDDSAPAATPTAMTDEVVDLLRQLRLPHMHHHAPELLATAKAQRLTALSGIPHCRSAEQLWGDSPERHHAGAPPKPSGHYSPRNSPAANAPRPRPGAIGFPTGKAFATWDQQISSIPTLSVGCRGSTRVSSGKRWSRPNDEAGGAPISGGRHPCHRDVVACRSRRAGPI